MGPELKAANKAFRKYWTESRINHPYPDKALAYIWFLKGWIAKLLVD